MPCMAPNKSYSAAGLRVVILLLALWNQSDFCEAQFGPLPNSVRAPQAKSQEELDAYLLIVAGPAKEQVIKAVDSFAFQFPKSELLGVAYQYQMHAYERLGDFNGTLSAGRRALANTPDNLDTLLSLAPEIANHATERPDRINLLVEADGYAHRALEVLEKVRPPHELSLDTWEKQRRAMQCQAHEVLGIVAVNQGKTETAIDEFGTAVRLAEIPTGSQYFRLAFAFASAGKKAEAAENFQRAVDLGPEPVRRLALQQIERISRSKSQH